MVLYALNRNRGHTSGICPTFWSVTGSERDGDAEDDAGQWRVIVEETVGYGRENQRWEITTVRSCEDRGEALRVASTMAESHQPQHPLSPRERSAYRIGSDTWLVRLTGMTRDYHFRISVARLVGGSET